MRDVRELLHRDLLGQVVVDRAGRSAGLAEHLTELAEHLPQLPHVEAATGSAAHLHAGQHEPAGQARELTAGAEARTAIGHVAGVTPRLSRSVVGGSLSRSDAPNPNGLSLIPPPYAASSVEPGHGARRLNR